MRRMHCIDLRVIPQIKQTDYRIGLYKYIYIYIYMCVCVCVCVCFCVCMIASVV
jgi:hypothetical protein